MKSRHRHWPPTLRVWADDRRLHGKARLPPSRFRYESYCAVRKIVSSRPRVFGLKGRNKSAQGRALRSDPQRAALGWRSREASSPERAKQSLGTSHSSSCFILSGNAVNDFSNWKIAHTERDLPAQRASSSPSPAQRAGERAGNKRLEAQRAGSSIHVRQKGRGRVIRDGTAGPLGRAG